MAQWRDVQRIGQSLADSLQLRACICDCTAQGHMQAHSCFFLPHLVRMQQLVLPGQHHQRVRWEVLYPEVHVGPVKPGCSDTNASARVAGHAQEMIGRQATVQAKTVQQWHAALRPSCPHMYASPLTHNPLRTHLRQKVVAQCTSRDMRCRNSALMQ